MKLRALELTVEDALILFAAVGFATILAVFLRPQPPSYAYVVYNYSYGGAYCAEVIASLPYSGTVTLVPYKDIFYAVGNRSCPAAPCVLKGVVCSNTTWPTVIAVETPRGVKTIPLEYRVAGG